MHKCWSIYNSNAEYLSQGLQGPEVCDEARRYAQQWANDLGESVFLGPDGSDWDELEEIEPTGATGVRCECGNATGENCGWRGPISETVFVEWMPPYWRASHKAAGNSGCYPSNGANRFRCHRDCAASIAESDPDWTEVL